MDNKSECPFLDSLGSKCPVLNLLDGVCNLPIRCRNDIRKIKLEIAGKVIQELLKTHRNTIESKAVESLLKSLKDEIELCETKKKISEKICSSFELLIEPSKISSLYTRNLVSGKIKYLGGGYDNDLKLMYEEIKFDDGKYGILIRIYKKDNENVLCDFYNDIKIDSFNEEQESFDKLNNFLKQCNF